jgi:hypothetical protein
MNMKNVYKNAMVDYIKSSKNQIITGAELVQVYKVIAKNNCRDISLDHVPLNVHKFAKKYGSPLIKVKNKNNRLTTVYYFNF